MVRRQDEISSIAEIWGGLPVFKDIPPHQVSLLAVLYEERIGWKNLSNTERKQAALEIASNIEVLLSRNASSPLLQGWANRENGRENAPRSFLQNSDTVRGLKKNNRLLKVSSAVLTGLLVLSAWGYQRMYKATSAQLDEDREIMNTQQQLIETGHDMAVELVGREKQIKAITDRILKDPKHVDPKDIEALRTIMNPPTQAKGR